MGPRSNWAVDLSVILARIDSMDPAGAAADAAELRRIMSAAQHIAGRITQCFGAADGLAGQGSVAADSAGLALGARVGDAAAALEPVQTALSAATADLGQSKAVRKLIPQMLNGRVFSSARDDWAAVFGTMMDRVYSDPMSPRSDGLHAIVASSDHPGTAVAGAGESAGIGGARGGAAGAAGSDRPAGSGDPGLWGPAPADPGKRGDTRAGADGSGRQSPDGADGSVNGAKMGAARSGPNASQPGGGNPPEDLPPGGAPAPAAAGTAPMVAAAGLGGAGLGGAGLGGSGTGGSGIRGGAAAVPGGSGAPTRVPVTSRSLGALPGLAGGASAANSGQAGAGPTGRGASGPTSAVPPGRTGGGAREDETRRRPDYLLSTSECVRMIGPLPLAGPPVLGDPAAGHETLPEAQAAGAPDADEDEDLDLTL